MCVSYEDDYKNMMQLDCDAGVLTCSKHLD